MGEKEFDKKPDELTGRSDLAEYEPAFSRIAALDLAVTDTGDSIFSVDLNGIIILEGIETIISKLLEEIRESCFFGQTDVTVRINIERGICPQLHLYGIQKISFSSLIENLEHFSVQHKQIYNHLNYIFNVLQSPGIHKGLFTQGEELQEPTALLFPFYREAMEDSPGLHYLVERIPGSHFLRITMEELVHSRLNLHHIKHRVISDNGLIDSCFNLPQVAFVIRSSLASLCRDFKLSYKDDGLQLSMLIRPLKSAGYASLREITVSWSRNVIHHVLSGNASKWHEHIIRLLLLLPDPTTLKILSGGRAIETAWNGTRAFITFTQRNRNLQIDLDEKLSLSGLDDYLIKMEKLNRRTQSALQSLSNHHLIFIHHFTSETLAVLGSFQRMGAHAVDTLWVKYSGGIPSHYLETILSLPGSKFNFYGLQQVTEEHFHTKFILSDRYSSKNDFADLQKRFLTGKYEFFAAMQHLAMNLFLRVMANGESTKVVIVEDGGYLAPLVNRLALDHTPVNEVFQKYGYKKDGVSEIDGKREFGAWIASRYCGSVEQTRNGHDALLAVENDFSGLAFPACSLAISRFKVHDESVEVAHSCINAIENILSGQGFVLNNRDCLVLGSLGAIGIQTMNILSGRLGQLSGIDLKTDHREYPWEQVTSYHTLKNETRYSVDLIFGVTGAPILDVAFFEDLILNTRRTAIFLASGSTKRVEFTNFLDWTEYLLGKEDPEIRGIPVKIGHDTIEDPLTKTQQGTIFSFELLLNGLGKQISFYVLSNGMPVNFQYYGVPRETMDQVMSEYLSLVITIAASKENVLPPRVLALDHDIDTGGKLIV